MSLYTNNMIQQQEVDLIEVFALLWKGKWVIAIGTFLAIVAAVGVALYLPNKYQSEVLLLPIDEESQSLNSSIANQFGNLATITGVNVGGNAISTETVRGLAILQSRAFITEFIHNHEIVVPIMAGVPGKTPGEIEIDDDLYDISSNQWVAGDSLESLPPSDWDVFLAFSDILTVNEDTETGLITISLEWYDRVLIKDWLNWLISDLNNTLRQRDLSEALLAIDYLEDQLGKTQLVEMRNIFNTLIEQQLQTVMLADVRDEYRFEIIDPAVTPEYKSSPSRVLIVLLSAIFGFFSMSLVVLLLEFRTRRNSN